MLEIIIIIFHKNDEMNFVKRKISNKKQVKVSNSSIFFPSFYINSNKEISGMKLYVAPFFILLICFEIECVVIYRFRTAKCSSSEKSIQFNFCYVKTYQKKLFTLNVSVNKTRIFGEDFVVNYRLEKMSASGKYEEKFHFDDIQWCSVVENAKKTPFLGTLINSLSSTVKEFIFDVCGKLGEVKAQNISVSNTIIAK